MKTSKYYSLKNILSKNCTYSLIIGERSNGKTYACLKYGIEQYVRDGAQLAVVRRWQDDFKSKRGASMFDALIANGEIDALTDPETAWAALEETRRYWDKLTDSGSFAGATAEMQRYLNGFALYQTIACRLWGRTSLWPNGGAYGFGVF